METQTTATMFWREVHNIYRRPLNQVHKLHSALFYLHSVFDRPVSARCSAPLVSTMLNLNTTEWDVPHFILLKMANSKLATGFSFLTSLLMILLP